jgi:hypothetical protein
VPRIVIISMVRVVVAVLELGPEPALEEVMVVEWVVVLEVVLVVNWEVVWVQEVEQEEEWAVVAGLEEEVV